MINTYTDFAQFLFFTYLFIARGYCHNDSLMTAKKYISRFKKHIAIPFFVYFVFCGCIGFVDGHTTFGKFIVIMGFYTRMLEVQSRVFYIERRYKNRLAKKKILDF